MTGRARREAAGRDWLAEEGEAWDERIGLAGMARTGRELSGLERKATAGREGLGRKGDVGCCMDLQGCGMAGKAGFRNARLGMAWRALAGKEATCDFVY